MNSCNMANWIWFLIVLLLASFAIALQEEAATTTDYDYDDDYYDDPEDQKEDLTTSSPKILKIIAKGKIKHNSNPVKIERDREELTTEKQFAKYEVTELVIDIPDTNTRRPILTNFTVTRPLNFAGVPTNKVNIGTNFKDEGDEVINTIFVPDQPKTSTTKPDINAKGRGIKFDEKDNNKDFGDFYSKNFFDDDSDEDDDFFDFGFEDEPKSKSFRDYFHDIKKGISSGFHSVINKHEDTDHPIHKFASSPFSFLSKLHKKSSELAKKIHNAVSRHNVHDFDDSFEKDC